MGFIFNKKLKELIMANMSAFRFENTLTDLIDCYNHINDELDSKKEIESRKQLIEVCKDIIEEYKS
jgi:hypothetical protein